MEIKLAGKTLYYDNMNRGRRYRPISKQVIYDISLKNKFTRVELARLLEISATTLLTIINGGKKGLYVGIESTKVYSITEKAPEKTTLEKQYNINKKLIDKCTKEMEEAKQFNDNVDKARNAGVDLEVLLQVSVKKEVEVEEDFDFEW